MRIIIFSNIPAPYFVEYLNELGKKCIVHAVFERRKASDRDQSWTKVNSNNFTYEFLQGIRIGTEQALSLKILAILERHRKDVIIFANPMTPTGVLGNLYCRIRRIPFALQSEGSNYDTNKKGLKESIKHFIVSGASFYLTGMKPERSYFRNYGAEVDKISWYPFASLGKKDLLTVSIDEKDKIERRKKSGITSDGMVIYVGRMLPLKGIDVLLKSFKMLKNKAHLFLIGGTATKEYESIIEDLRIENVHFIPHIQLDELKEYYCMADICVLPTRHDSWGLVINEAMAFGVPVITTDMCVAGVELIKDGENGYITHVDDAVELRNRIDELLENKKLRKSMSNNNIKKMQEYTYENMASRIYEGIRYHIENE